MRDRDGGGIMDRTYSHRGGGGKVGGLVWVRWGGVRENIN